MAGVFADGLRLFSVKLAQVVGERQAIVLNQLHFWLEKSQNKHDGKRWVYNTYDQWHEFFPHWSLRTVRRVICDLRVLGVVIVRSDLNKMRIDRTLWYTIDYEKVDELCAKCPTWPHASVQTGHKDVSNLAVPITKEVTEKSTKKAGDAKSEDGMKIEKGSSLAEIQGMLVKEKAKEPLPPKKQSGAVMMHWMVRLCQFHYDDMAKMPLPLVKDIGQMGHLIKQCKEAGTDAATMLKVVVKDWSGFADAVRAKKGIDSAPTRPVIGFLLQNSDVALNYAEGKAIVKESSPVQLMSPGKGKVLW